MPKAFLSHSSRDKEFVRELYRRLTRDGVACFFDEQSIEWGDNFVLKLEEGVDECEFFVPVLSPDFVASKWVTIERASALADLRAKIRPLLLRPCDVPRFFKQIQMLDVSTAEKFEAAYPKICAGLGGTPRPDARPTEDRSVAPDPEALPAGSRMPHRSLGAGFVGRVDELWRLHDQLRQCRPGVGIVYGAGGLGKTQIAIEYAHRFNAHYPGGVFWVEADQGIQRLIDVLSRALDAQVDGKLPAADQLGSVWSEAARRAAMLIVLDNFPETGSLREWLPPSGDIATLVTTRRRDLTRYAGFALPVLTADEGQQLLGVRSDGARALVEAVGGLPLAVELLRAQLAERTDLRPDDLLRALTKSDIAALERFAEDYRDDLPDGHARSVAATVQASWERASEDGREVLRAMAHLAAAPVPLRLLRAILRWEAAEPIEDRLGRAAADLFRLSLVERDAEGRPAAHRLILGFARTMADAERYRKAALDTLAAEMARARDLVDTAAYRDLEEVLPHAEAAVEDAKNAGEAAVFLADCVAWHHHTLGRYRVAKQVSETAAALADRVYPSGTFERWLPLWNLSIALRSLGELEKALEVQRKLLEVWTAAFPASDPRVAKAQSNLAVTLHNLGQFGEAADLLRKALASEEKHLDPNDPELAIRRSNLAAVLQEDGQFEEARDLLRKSLASAERSLPAGHPTITTCQSNLAIVLRALGEANESADLLRKALASDRASYPAGHPSIATDEALLARVLYDLGEIEEARRLAQSAYSATAESQGPDHPMTRSFHELLTSLAAHA